MAASSAEPERGTNVVQSALGPVSWVSIDQASDDRRAELTRIYTDEHDRLVRTVALITSSVAAAEDIVQDSFAKLYTRLGEVENPGAWLHTVSVNAARNVLRHRLVRRRHLDTESARPTSAADAHHELLASLRRLPTRQRAVVVLRYYEDRSEAEIAAILGIRPGTVKSSLHRGLAALRQEIEL